MDTQTIRVSDWIMNTRLEDIPQNVIHLGKLQFLDSIAAICAGYQSDAGAKIGKLLLEHSDHCQIFPTGESTHFLDAIYIQSSLINALEMDNFCLMGHFSQSAFSVSYSLGCYLKKSFNEVLRAFILGIEVGGRLSAYMATGPLQGHMRSFAHRCTAAVTSACLLDLNRDQTAHAISIALSAPEFPLLPASFSPETKVILTASPAVEGCRSAFLAQQNLTSALDVLEHPLGFWTYFSYMDYIPDVWLHIGKSWSCLALSTKNYASCAYAQAAVEATVQLCEISKFESEDIAAVNIDTTLVSVIMESFSLPHYGADITPINTQFSVIRSVAATLLFGTLDGYFYQKGNFDSKGSLIIELSKKISLRHDWAQTVDLVRGFDRGLINGGRPGILGLTQTNKLTRILNKSLGSKKLFGVSDIIPLLRLKPKNLFYFLGRYWRGKRADLPFMNKKKKASYFSHEGDIGKMEFRLSARVNVRLHNGQQISSECRIPSGFAGNARRERILEKKFFRESSKVLGATPTQAIWDLVQGQNMDWSIRLLQEKNES